MKKQSLIYFTSSAAALLAGLVNPAQSVAQAATPQAAPAANSPGAQAATADGPAIADIVVTAQRRRESLQKTAVVLSVLSSEALARAGVTQPQALASILPGVQIGNAGPLLQVYVRGVGDAGVGATSNPAVAFNIDGVYASRSQSISTEMYDVDRVEVLKGPQGTLYGRNATGGAVNLITRKPKLDEYSAHLSVEHGNFESTSVDAAVNIPLGPTLAARISGIYVSKDGYTSEGFDDDKHKAIRGKLLWEPSSKFSVLLNGSIGHVGGKGGSFAVIVNKIPGLANQSPWLDQTDPRARSFLLSSVAPTLPKTPGTLNPPSPNEAFQDLNFRNVSAEINADLGFANLTVLPAFRHMDMLDEHLNFLRVSTGAAFGNVPQNPETSDEATLEARLSKDIGGLKLVAGAYAYHENQFSQYVNKSGLIQNLGAQYELNTRSYAGFGQATYAITSKIRAIGGLRYTTDERAINGYSVTLAPSLKCPGVAPTFCPAESFEGEKTYRKVSWKGGLEADVLGQGLAYATVSSGFKGGSFNPAISPTAAPTSHDASSYAPETLVAYEIGLKNRYFNNKLQLNLEGFYWDYDNLQQARIAVSGAGNSAYSVDNAGKARMFGGSADIIAKPWSGGTFTGNVEYLNAKYLSFIVNQPAKTYLAGSSGCPVTPSTQAPSASGPLITINCAGFQVNRSPKWTGSVGYSHHLPLSNGGALEPDVNMQFASARWLASDFVAAERASNYQTFNASLTYVAPNNRFTIAGFVRNIGNAAVYEGAFEAPYQPGVVGANIAPPRTYGFRFSISY